ncbi:bifunctional diaminohydroxyphosphoribosylaminopyrimidine deaminase/5-amino-6-(5-phosphoribosylamino)uracil reductase RibD [Mesonia sp. K7]|uniref:bifunctional diaminohydroxyphosphoribosylaminopyrimidine deaminase/5-amino-6-(5-phosphoribosylamino)uracil reductase RibD n=1 Tax=Mesonia sp. K7 TaxID=2218606 RepID=UPI000DA780B9|nr:bifunctional diaminohydroxyphosphoribosylaminopyrimidine deaminase/5-amino-6-(5-phosphoribosylamino)uracil reductase RibD [Mesonia sp. K7]PZD79576.1 bifunctional diaminohydroxyphosphoribosylaminopyrimidine deaminase/5-amino-6-(5-phosphoribosylamino)uracil reductase RibD [Mesonia sp. K7]
MKIHEKYINRCIKLAKNGLGTTYPNPMVGSLLVYKNRIIGEGWHQQAGKPHAEVNAIQHVEDDRLLSKSTIYVTLEPCSHYGKTPPCADLIIEKGIKKVVIGTIDPHTKVAGKGIKKLIEAGCEVVVGVLEKECQALNKRFFTFHQKKRPYVILKWAQTQDGFIAPAKQTERKSVNISNDLSRQLVHKWRSEEQSILVGTTTALKDNPRLDARKWKGNHPIRLVIDKGLKIPTASFLFDETINTFVFTEKGKTNKNNLIYKRIDFSQPIVPQVLEELYQENIQSVLVEGGSKTLQSFIDAKLWDEARVFTGHQNLVTGIKAPDFDFPIQHTEKIENNLLQVYQNNSA